MVCPIPKTDQQHKFMVTCPYIELFFHQRMLIWQFYCNLPLSPASIEVQYRLKKQISKTTRSKYNPNEIIFYILSFNFCLHDINLKIRGYRVTRCYVVQLTFACYFKRIGEISYCCHDSYCCFLIFSISALSSSGAASLFLGNQDHQQVHTLLLIFRGAVPWQMLLYTIFQLLKTYGRHH